MKGRGDIPDLTTFQEAVLGVLRSYEAARLELSHEQRKVLRSIVAARLARDIINEEFCKDLDDLAGAA